MMPRTIWTLGHSDRELEEFLSMLHEASIDAIADVRRFPGSKANPQYGQDALAASLRENGIEYRHFPRLGGRRSDRIEDSPNQGWRVEAFNAYADYMLTDDFQEGLQELEEFALQQPTAIMCAELVPWRCHRRLIADALIADGWDVWDIFSEGRIKEHVLTKFAVIRDDHPPIYPAAELEASPA
ncbi:hypothetical protein Mal4_42960 [Maioricimonas rarisocia]|uniref:DUF488 domain-containing protein n=1 Tax=Maioricimonas rarisocia TaxID=2528026 RepID=A0A517ZBR9_9PLAN|nr:DUF488 domain-containing protein [Maioricimonas rarisocia]QDU39942.1 hypothetical protein Mal4_42960 [Maioricimonas rarisocia]